MGTLVAEGCTNGGCGTKLESGVRDIRLSKDPLKMMWGEYKDDAEERIS